jgi:hypothetical protein
LKAIAKVIAQEVDISGYIYSEITCRLFPEIFVIAQKYLISTAKFNQSLVSDIKGRIWTEDI